MLCGLPLMAQHQGTQDTQVRSLVGKILSKRKWQLLQYSYLKNPMDRGAWRATVSNKFPSFLDVLYSSGLWRIPSSLANLKKIEYSTCTEYNTYT